MSKWYEKTGKNSDAVISTRIRLARNLKDHPFPQVLSPEKRKAVCEMIRDAVFQNSYFSEFKYIDMETISDVEAVAMAEKHIISPEFATDRSGRGLIINDEESISIMLCEEDHIRIQIIRSGLEFEDAYAIADNIDNLFDESLNYAFDEQLGYLTACPTNLGTGMRASVMLHLPALKENGSIQRIITGLSKIGLTVRGIYGEGSDSKGALFQLSNQVTLGLSEKSAIDNLKNISVQIIEQERSARDTMMLSDVVVDKINRSYGILKYATLLTNDEALKYLSNVRLGAACSMFSELSPEKINKLMIISQPGMIITQAGKTLSQRECDAQRAKIIRSDL